MLAAAAGALAAFAAVRFDDRAGQEVQAAQAGGGEPAPFHQLAHAALTNAEELSGGADG
jgi:hypothetical protein